MRRETLDAPVRTNDDLFRLWQALMGTEGFGVRTLWLVFLHRGGYPAKVILPIDDVPIEPDPVTIRALGRAIEPLADELDLGSVPALLSRPGPSAMTRADRRWAAALRQDAPELVTRWPIHLATANRVQVFAPDDLILAS